MHIFKYVNIYIYIYIYVSLIYTDIEKVRYRCINTLNSHF